MATTGLGTKDFNYGIDNYKPKLFSNYKKFLIANKKKMEAMVGKRLDAIYLAWDTKEGWQNFMPVIFVIGRRQYQIYFNELDKLSLTSIEIDIKKKWDPWLAVFSDSDFVTYWKKYAKLKKFIGKKIVKVNLHVTECDTPQGLEFVFDMTRDNHFIIENYGDEAIFATGKFKLNGAKIA